MMDHMPDLPVHKFTTCQSCGRTTERPPGVVPSGWTGHYVDGALVGLTCPNHGADDPTSWVNDAIRDALQRGMVPFVAVVPVSPHALRDAAVPLDEMIGRDAAEGVARAVREWQEQNDVATT